MKTVVIVTLSALLGAALAASAAAPNTTAPSAMSTATPAGPSAAIDKNPAATPTTAAPATNAPVGAAPLKAGTVARATLTTGVVEHEPIDRISAVTNDKSRIYYFTELHDMAGQSVTHRWEHNGKIMSEVKLNVGGPRWRVYSSKTLDPRWTGEWKVSVVDANGTTLGANTFSYTTASAADINHTAATGAAAPATLKAATPAPSAEQKAK